MTAYSIPPLLTLFCFFGLAVLTLGRGPRTKVRILFSIICVLGCFLYIDILFAFNLKSETTALLVSRIDHGFIVYLLPLYIHFFHVYLNIPGRKWIVRVGYGFAFIMMCLTPTSLYIQSMEKHPFGFYAKGGDLYPLFALAGLAVTLYVLGLVFKTMHNEPDNTRRNRLKYVLAGFGVMGLLNSLSVLPSIGVSIYPPGNFSFIPLTVFYVGLFRHDLLDLGILVRKGLVYSLFTALITGLYALIITTANRMFSTSQLSDSIYVPALFFLIVVIVFGPLKTKTQYFIDQLFYKGKYDYQKTIRQASRIIAADRDLERISHRLVGTLVNAMKVDTCALYLATTEPFCFTRVAAGGNGSRSEKPGIPASGPALIRLMAARPQTIIKSRRSQGADNGAIIDEMNTMGAAVILPLVFNGRLTGFIALGEKRSGDLFTREDVDLLETLANHTALAVENARSYKCIKDLNKNLEATVMKRTKALTETLAEKEKTQEQLIRSESLAAIGQLVAGTAHELNNPLTSATSLIQSVIEDLVHRDNTSPSNEDLVDDLAFADRELARAKSIVASLLGLSRQTQTYAEAVDFNTVVEDALRVLYSRSKHDEFHVVTDLSGELPHIRGNFANLGQVVLNIIQNAMDAVTQTSGEISLSTRYNEPSGQIVFECLDTGPGIPASIRGDIFKPFFTTKPVGKGTGLGLYICHEIIRRHNGSLILEKDGCQGAGFVVKLPVNQQHG